MITYKWGSLLGEEYVRISLFDPYIWNQIAFHVGLQGLVFFGASFFHKYSIIKTALISLGLYFFLVVLLNLLMVSFFPDLDIKNLGGYFSRNGYMSFLIGGELDIGNSPTNMLPNFIKNVPRSVWFYSLSLIALGISYLRFTELEA